MSSDTRILDLQNFVMQHMECQLLLSHNHVYGIGSIVKSGVGRHAISCLTDPAFKAPLVRLEALGARHPRMPKPPMFFISVAVSFLPYQKDEHQILVSRVEGTNHIPFFPLCILISITEKHSTYFFQGHAPNQN